MIRIIGVGSAFNDDNIGWLSLQNLVAELQQLAANIEITYCANPATQLIHLLQPGTVTVLVDALQAEQAIGKVREIEISDLHNDRALSSHNISVSNILQLANNLHRLPEHLFILGIGINPQEYLTGAQRQLLQQQLLDKIQAIINDIHRH